MFGFGFPFLFGLDVCGFWIDCECLFVFVWGLCDCYLDFCCFLFRCFVVVLVCFVVSCGWVGFVIYGLGLVFGWCVWFCLF